jgi:hypothetical protein
MQPRRKSAHRNTAELLTNKDLGWDARVFEDSDVVELLRASVEREGNQMAFAKRHGLNRAHLNFVLRGKRPPSSNVVDILGLRKVYTAKQRQ